MHGGLTIASVSWRKPTSATLGQDMLRKQSIRSTVMKSSPMSVMCIILPAMQPCLLIVNILILTLICPIGNVSSTVVLSVLHCYTQMKKAVLTIELQRSSSMCTNTYTVALNMVFFHFPKGRSVHCANQVSQRRRRRTRR